MKNKKLKIYFDTSVPSSFYDITAPEQTAITRLFWEDYLKDFSDFVSEATMQEIKRTRDIVKRDNVVKLVNKCRLLKINKVAEDLAGEYIKAKIIPASYPIDALHVACATVNKIDYLVTWNISHMANPNRRKKLTEFNAKNDLYIPQLTTPEEIIQSYEQK